MPRDLFEEHGIEVEEQPRDLFEGMDMKDLSSKLKKEPEDNSSGILNFLKGLGVGGVESLANVAPSVANVALGPIDYFAGTNFKRPYVNLEEFRPQTTGGHIGHIAGNIAGVLAPGGIATKALTKLLGSPGVLKTAAATAAANAGISGGDNEFFHRGLAGLTGIIPLAQGLRTKPLIAKAAEKKTELGKHFNKEYEGLFEQADKVIPKEQGLKIPQLINTKKGSEALSEFKEVKKAVGKFTSEPSIRNAHKAQSDLGKFIRGFEKANLGKPLSSTKIDAIETAKKLQDKIRDSMTDAFVRNNQKGLAKEYDFLTNEYREKMVPYLGKALAEHMKNPKATPAKKVLQEMRRKQGEIGKGEYYKDLPGFAYKNKADVILPPLLKYGAAPALGLEGAKLLSEYLK